MRGGVAGIGLVVISALALGGWLFFGRSAKAESELPAKMTLLDAAQLHAALAELSALKLQEAPHQLKVAEIAVRSKFRPDELGRTVGVNFETGEIVRVSPQGQAAPQPGKP